MKPLPYFCGFVGVAALSLQSSLALQYEVFDLGTLGGTSSSAYGINQAGQVVGSASTAAGNSHAFLYEKGNMMDLGTLGGANSVARAINDSGVVVGSADNNSGSPTAFRWEVGPLTAIPGFTGATAINNSGQIVVNTAQSSAIFFNGAAGPPNGLMLGNSIEPNGVVGGSYMPAGPRNHAAVVTNGILTDYHAQILAASIAGMNSTQLTAFNDLGHFVGFSMGFGLFQGYLYADGAIQIVRDFSTFMRRTTAADVNNVGQVVGSSSTEGGTLHAFIFRNGITTDLNTLIDPSLGWELEVANGINDTGEIVGYGRINGQTHAFLLRPSEPSQPTTVPTRAVSRLTHGTLGPLDLPIDLSGGLTTECRNSDGAYQVLIYFPNAVSFANARLTSGTGVVSNSAINASATVATVDLTGVANAQAIVLALTVTAGTATADVSIPLSILIGDSSGNGAVNAGDISQIKSLSGATVTTANLRSDVTRDGTINASDISMVKSHSGESNVAAVRKKR